MQKCTITVSRPNIVELINAFGSDIMHFIKITYFNVQTCTYLAIPMEVVKLLN